MDRTWRAVLGKKFQLSLVLYVYAALVLADPIDFIDFNKCQTSAYRRRLSSTESEIIQCCPANPSSQLVVDGLPIASTPYIRTRMAAQCTDSTYAAKLDKAYQLMRALPDDDPRSFTQQWITHCAYCGGAFYETVPNDARIAGIDIHFSWLFYPWHRFFLYFHERILQSLLGDPSFSLSYWNWDNPYTVGKGHSFNGACLQAGHNFPAAYASTSSATYDGNRSQSALGYGRHRFPDFSLATGPLYNATADAVIQSNLNILYQAMVSGSPTAETFVGRPYRIGDIRVVSPLAPGGGGTLENSAHAGVHLWTGVEPPSNEIDMGFLPYAARDPVFFAHHSNLDRLFQIWKDIGPVLGQNRQYYSDPDFLNATFLFYDETKTSRRVKVSDGLTTEGLGYTYQLANDAAWIHHNSSRCSVKDYRTLINEAQSLPAPVKQADGYYHLKAEVPFVTIVDQPSVSSGGDQYFVMDRIKMNRRLNVGFDVYLNLLDPKNYTSPTGCREYLGRFMNMKRKCGSSDKGRLLTWRASISGTLSSLQVPAPPSPVVVTIVPQWNPNEMETITFSSIFMTTDPS